MDEYLNEKEQWEQVLAWLREQGPWMVAGVAVVLAGWGGWHYWQQREEQRDLQAASRYEQLLDAFSRNDLSGGVKLADDLVASASGTPYANQADLAAARIQVENKDLDHAAQRLARVMNTTKDPQLALVARLRLARVQLSQGKNDAALGTLDGAQPGAFAARYAEVRGDVLLAKGDRDGALKQYRAARSAAASTVDTGLLDLKISDLARS